jgi:nitrogen fixation protein NifQ
MQNEASISDAEIIYNQLLQSSEGGENAHLLATILASWVTGGGCLPQWLGMSEKSFRGMMEKCFPDYLYPLIAAGDSAVDEQRFDEREEVLQLLMQHRAGMSETEEWLAEIVTVACQGQDHLWQDMGLWSRKDLSKLLSLNFPSLAAKNDRDMKWKKFIYKQLCITEGIYTCRAPSCEVCADYDKCFGPED